MYIYEQGRKQLGTFKKIIGSNFNSILSYTKNMLSQVMFLKENVVEKTSFLIQKAS